jgi:hypothetical protein
MHFMINACLPCFYCHCQHVPVLFGNACSLFCLALLLYSLTDAPESYKIHTPMSLGHAAFITVQANYMLA